MFRIEMESVEYGVECFDYLTEGEAIAGFKRLRLSAIEHIKKDGVNRSIILTWTNG